VNNLARNLHYLIKRFDTTQAEVAAFAQVSQNSISNWINEISHPGAPVIIRIHRYFGISIDALLLKDLEKSRLITDAHVEEFKRLGKDGRKAGTIKSVSKKYFKGNDGEESIVNEPESVTSGALMTQLKQIRKKIDQLKISVDAIPKKKA
jgi:transcriptional regulator with XRE-family HTH domain